MDDRADAQSVRGFASTSGNNAAAPPRSAKREKFRPGLIQCDVSNPSKSVGFFDQHVQFRVGCSSTLRDYVATCRVELIAGHANFTVTRRFNDFVWVRDRLRKLYPGVRRLTRTTDRGFAFHFARFFGFLCITHRATFFDFLLGKKQFDPLRKSPIPNC